VDEAGFYPRICRILGGIALRLNRGIVVAAASAVCLSCLVPLSTSAAKAATGTVEVVDPTVEYQTIQGWGTSLAWFAHILGGANDPVRNQIADLIFSPTKGLGLNVVRYNIGGGENPNIPDTLALRARIPGYEPSQGTWDWSADANQRWFLQAAKKRGADVFEAFSNSPPYWMTNSGSVTGGKDGADNLNPLDYGAFGTYLATVVKHFQDQWGIQFDTVEPLNEPSGTWWSYGGSQEGDHEGTTAQANIIDALAKALSDNQSVTRISAPDENTIDQTLSSWNTYSPTTQSYVSQINTHTYGGTNRTGLYNAAYLSNKRLWVSEHGDGDGTGIQMSDSILQDMTYLHPSAWVYWQAVDDSSAPGWGFLVNNLNAQPNSWTYTFNEKYYVMGQYSEFVRPGYQFIRMNNLSGQPDAAAFLDHATNTLVIVATNDQNTSESMTYDLSGFNSVGVSADEYQTTAYGGLNENLQSLPKVPIVDGNLSTNLPAQSVTTFVIHNAVYRPARTESIDDSQIGTGVGQVQYQGNWISAQGRDGEGDMQSTTSGASYDVRFEGTQALLYGDKGPDLGMETVSVDNGIANTVDLYSPNPQHDVLIFATPTVQSGLHTLVVRNTGRVDSNELTDRSGSFLGLVPSERVVVVPDNSLLVNSDFSTGDLTGWQGQWHPSYAGVEDGYPYDGTYDGYLHPQSNGDVGMDQTVTAPVTGTYTLTAECATAFSNGVQLGANVNGTGGASTYITANVGYQPYKLTFSAKRGDAINVWYYAAKSGWNWATIDDVRLSQPMATPSLNVSSIVKQVAAGGVVDVVGTVYQNPGIPAANVTVSMSSNDGGTFDPPTTSTDVNGNFQFRYTAPLGAGADQLTVDALVGTQTVSGTVDLTVLPSSSGDLPEVPFAAALPIGLLACAAVLGSRRSGRP